jgi:hypothetical protein
MTPIEFDSLLQVKLKEAVTIMQEGDTKIANLLKDMHDEICANDVEDHTACTKIFCKYALIILGIEYTNASSDLEKLLK